MYIPITSMMMMMTKGLPHSRGPKIKLCIRDIFDHLSHFAQIDWIAHLVNNEPRAALLKTICDDSIVDKNSVNGKVFSSFLYLFGRKVTDHCSPEEWKSYFSVCFEVMWNMFPNWQLLNENGVAGISASGDKRSLKGFARRKAQSATAKGARLRKF